MFAGLGTQGHIGNVVLYSSTLKADNKAGGLVADSHGYITGIEANSSDVDVKFGTSGLIVGFNRGNLTHSSSSGVIVQSENGNNLGGIAGINYDLIHNVSSSATVEGDAKSGGIAGSNVNGKINLSYFNGKAISGRDNDLAGGIAGSNDGTINLAYSEGYVEASRFAGGIAGLTSISGKVSLSYSSSEVKATKNRAGAIIGRNRNILEKSYGVGKVTGTDSGGASADGAGNTYRNVYWDINSTRQDASNGGTGLYTSQLKDNTSIEGFDFQNTWEYVNGSNDNYPVLQAFNHQPKAPNASFTYDKNPGTEGDTFLTDNPVQFRDDFSGGTSYNWSFDDGGNFKQGENVQYTFTSPGTYNVTMNASNSEGWDIAHRNVTVIQDPFAGGSGTPGDPYEISSCFDLQNMSLSLDSSYELVSDIDCSNTKNWNNGKGFNPVGNRTHEYRFDGKFYGRGHVIKYLNISRSSENQNGLFGVISADSVLRNLTLNDAYVEGKLRNGILVGWSYGKLEYVATEGRVKSVGGTGGIAGITSTGSLVVNSSSDSVVSGDYSVGSLIGSANGEVKDTFSAGEVREGGLDSRGGLVGDVNSGLNRSFSYAEVDAPDSSAGGLTGEDKNLNDFTYWDINASGQSTSAGGTGLYTSQLKGNDSLNGFDYSSTWAVGDKNQGYPYLQDVPVIPVIYDFKLERKGNGNLNVSFKVGQQLSDINVTVDNGNDWANLTENDFTRSGLMYHAEYSASTGGYQAMIKEAVSSENGLDGADDETARALCDSGTIDDHCMINTTVKLQDQTPDADFDYEINGTGNLTIQSNGKLQAEYNTESVVIDMENITIKDGGSIRANVNITANNLTVEEGGVINATGLGYEAPPPFNVVGTGLDGKGSGAPNYNGASPGAGYGGRGGNTDPQRSNVDGGESYGNIKTPTGFGSSASGGYNINDEGGSGGGRIKVGADVISLRGTISTNGQSAVDPVGDGGGGSGGSILLNTTEIEGSGQLYSEGGKNGRLGGSGAGGRISFARATASSISKSVKAGKLSSASVNGLRGEKANPGTIYPRNTICDSGNLSTDCTLTEIHENSIPDFNGTNLTVKSGAALKSGQNLTLNFSHITIEEDANITATKRMDVNAKSMNVSGKIDVTARPDPDFSDTNRYLDLNVSDLGVSGGLRANVNISSDNFTLAENGWLNASGLGYKGAQSVSTAGSGPGGGGLLAARGGCGGGYGARGGNTQSTDNYFCDGGISYGSLEKPTGFGSGGGAGHTSISGHDGPAGDGGGRLYIETETADLKGILKTNGEVPKPESETGGGSGGSVFLNSSTLSGNAGITANGSRAGNPGEESTPNEEGGGGAGGRVAIYTDSSPSSYDLSIDVSGGEGFEDGGDGTVYTPLDVKLDRETVKDGEKLSVTGEPAVEITGTRKGHGIQVWQNGEEKDLTGWDGPAPNLSLTEGIGDGRHRFSPEVYDLDEDGNEDELIYGETAGRFYGYEWNGKKWERNQSLTDGLVDIGLRSNPSIADFNHDGSPEMVAGSTLNFAAFRWNGSAWNNDTSLKQGLSVMIDTDNPDFLKPDIADFNNDQEYEMVVGSGDGGIAAFQWDGTHWNRDDQTLLKGASDPVFTSVFLGDIGNNGQYELGISKGQESYHWNGSKWIPDSTYNQTIPDSLIGFDSEASDFNNDGQQEFISIQGKRPVLYGWQWKQPLTNSTADFTYYFTPKKAGNHTLTFNSTNGTKLAGESSEKYFVKDELTLENNRSRFVSENDNYIDIDDADSSTKVNLSVKVYENIDQPIDWVNATVTSPDGNSETFSLSGSSTETSTWSKDVNLEDIDDSSEIELGRYNVSFTAKSTLDGSAIREGLEYNSSFYVRNVSMPFEKDQDVVNPGEKLELNGTVYSKPSDSTISDTGIGIFVNGEEEEWGWSRYKNGVSGLPSSSPGAPNPYIFDFNSDGRSEFFDSNTPNKVSYWNGSEWVRDSDLEEGPDLSGSRGDGAGFGDIDSDGRIELVHLGGGLLTGLEWNGSGWSDDQKITVGATIRGDVGDIDNDGNFELVDRFTTYRWEGYWERDTTLDLPNLPKEEYKISDPDGDNTAELITGKKDGRFRAYKWTGSGYSRQNSLERGLPDIGSRSKPGIGDFDNDGFYEMIAGNLALERYGFKFTKPVTTSSGNWTYNLYAPQRAGTYDLKINTTDQNYISGSNSTSFNVSLPIDQQKAEFNATGDEHLDVDGSDQTVNLTAFVGNSSDSDVNRVYVEVEDPETDGSSSNTEFELQNTTFKNSSQTWFKSIDVSSQFSSEKGRYNLTFKAETERGIGSEVKEASFYVENSSITQKLDDYRVNPGEEVEVTGTSRNEPYNDRNPTDPVNVYKENETGNLTSVQKSDVLKWDNRTDWEVSTHNRVESDEFGLVRNDSVELGINLRKKYGEGLLVWYPLDKLTYEDLDSDGENEFQDLSGNGYYGNVYGDPEFPELFTNEGTSLKFDGTDDYIKSIKGQSEYSDNQSSIIYQFRASSESGLVSVAGNRQSGQKPLTSRIMDDTGIVSYTNYYDASNQKHGISKSLLEFGQTYSVGFSLNAENGNYLRNYLDSNLVNQEIPNGDYARINNFSKVGRDAFNVYLDGEISKFALWNRSLSNSTFKEVYYSNYNGSLTTDYKTTREKTTELYLRNLNYSLNGGSIEVTVQSDHDGDGTVEENSSMIELDGDSSYQVRGLEEPSDRFRLFIELSSDNVTKSPVLHDVEVVAGEVSSSDSVEIGRKDFGIQVRNLTGSLRRNLIARYPLDEGANATVGPNGAVEGDVYFTDGPRSSNAAKFDGVGDGIDLGTPAELQFSDESFTVSAWAYQTDDTSSAERIISADSGGTAGDMHGYRLIGNSGADKSVFQFSNDTNTAAAQKEDLFTGQWNHWIGVYDKQSQKAKLFRNGDLIAESGGESGQIMPDYSEVGNIYIGSRGGANYFKGRIDEVRFYNRSLSSDEARILSGITTANESSLTTNIIDTGTYYRVEGNTPELIEVKASLNGNSGELEILSDPDNDGSFEETSDAVSLNGNGGPYTVSGLSRDSRKFKFRVNLSGDAELKSFRFAPGQDRAGDYRRSFYAPTEPGNYTVKVNTTDENGISGTNTTTLSVFNLTSRVEDYPENVFKDNSDQIEFTINDSITADPENPMDVYSVDHKYWVPPGWSVKKSILGVSEDSSTPTDITASRMEPGDTLFFQGEINVKEDAKLGPRRVVVNGSSSGGIFAQESEFEVEHKGLVGYWKLNENSGTVNDSSEFGNSGQVQGSVERGIKGKFGRSYLIDAGDSEEIKIDSKDLRFNSTDDFSISAWIKVKEFTDGGTMNVINLKSYQGVGMDLNRNNKLVARMRDENGNSVSLKTSRINKNIWKHAVLVWDSSSSKIKLYEDGNILGNATNTDVHMNTSSSDDFYIGGQSRVGGNAASKGRQYIDDVRVYNRTLSHGEIEELSDPRGRIIDVWTRSQALFLGDDSDSSGSVDVQSPIPRSDRFFQVQAEVEDDVNGSRLKGINTSVRLLEVTDTGLTPIPRSTKYLVTNESGMVEYNWSTAEYGRGDFRVEVKSVDEPGKYINSTGVPKTTDTFNVLGVFEKQSDTIIDNSTLLRDNSTSGPGIDTETDFSVKFENSLGSLVENANVSWKFPDKTINDTTDSDGVARITYNPSDTLQPGEYNVTVTATKNLYQPYSFNRTIEIRGKLDVEENLDEKIITRGLAPGLESTVTDENGVTTEANVNWKINNTLVATGEDSQDAINTTIDTGRNRTLKVTAYKEYYRPVSDTVNVTVYGNADITELYPPNTTILPGTEINATATVKDSNTSEVVDELPVQFSVNGTEISRNLTSNGRANFFWEPDQGVHLLEAEISDNSTVLYNTSLDSVKSEVEIDRELYIESVNRSETKIFRPDTLSPSTSEIDIKVTKTSRNATRLNAGNERLYLSLNGTDEFTCTTSNIGECSIDVDPALSEVGNNTLEVLANKTGYENDTLETFLIVKGSFTGLGSRNIVQPSSSEVVRGKSYTAEFEMVDDLGDPVTDVPVTWEFASRTLGLTERQGEFTVSVEENLGTQPLKAEADSRFYYDSADSDSVLLEVFGKSNVELQSPGNATKVGYSETPEVVCKVDDQNGDAINEYPVEFFQNKTVLGTDTTNLDGQAILENWNVPNKVTEYEVGCRISDNSTLNYKAADTNSSRLYETKDTKAPTVSNLSVNPQELRPDEEVEINFTATDEVEVTDVYVEIEDPIGAPQRVEVSESNGVYETTFTPEQRGTYTVTAKAEDSNGNVGEDVSTFKTSKAASINLDPNVFTADKVQISENQSYNTSVELEADGDLEDVNVSVNVSSDYESLIGYNSSPRSCGNLNDGDICSNNFTITVEEGVAPQTAFVGFSGEWLNASSGNKSFVRSVQTVEVQENPVLTVSPETKSETGLRAANDTYNISADVENIGNYEVREFDTSFESTNLSNSNIRFYNGKSRTIPSSESTSQRTQTVKTELFAQYGLDPGTYKANISYEGEQSSTNSTFEYQIDKYRNFEVTPKFEEPVIVVDQQQKIGTIEIKSLSNVDIDVSREGGQVNTNLSEGNLNASFPTAAQLEPLETYRFPIYTDEQGIPSTGSYRLQYVFDTSIGRDYSKTSTFDIDVVDLSADVFTDTDQETVDIRSADTDQIKFEVREGDKLRTENLNFSVKLVNETQGISQEANIVQSTESGNFTLEYGFPSIEDGRVYDLVLEINDTDLGVNLEQRIDGKYLYNDVTEPEFENVDVSDVFKGEDVDVNVSVSDNSLDNISQVTYKVDFPSGTKKFDLNRTKNSYWQGSFQTPSNNGDYRGVLKATDQALNNRTFTEYFRVGDREEFSGKFNGPDGEPLKADVTLKDPDTGEEIKKFNIDADSRYSEEVFSGRYDVEIKTQGNTVTLEEADISGEDPVDITELSGREAPAPKSKAKVMGLGVRQKADPNGGEFTLDYSEFEDNVPADEGITDVEIGRCQDYNYSEIECQGSWKQLSDDAYTADKADKTVSATVPGFSVYTLYFPEENDTQLEEIQKEIEETQSSVGGVSGNLSELGRQIKDQNNGSGTGTGNNPATGAATQSGLELGSQEITADIQPGQSNNIALSLLNNFDSEQEFRFSTSTAVGQYMDLPDEITLDPGESRTITIEVSAPADAEPSAYSGFLNIESDEVDNQIPVNIDIVPPDQELLDLSVNPVFSSVQPGEDARVEVTLSNQGYTRNVDVAVDLSIVDPETNETLATTERTLAVGTSLTRVFRMDIPDDADLTQYEVRGTARYSNLEVSRVATAVSNINVQKPFWQRQIFGTVSYGVAAIAFILLTIASASGYGIYQWHRRKVMAKKRYMEQIDLDTIPTGGRRQAFMGELAEMGTRTFLELDDLTTHAIIAGATGSGKTVTGQDVVEEALKEGVNVIVLDPTAQWSGYLRECKEDDMLRLYSEFGMNEPDTRSFNGNIRAVEPDQDTIDIKPYLQSTEEGEEGEIIVFSMHKLDNADTDGFIADTIQQVFDNNCQEANELNTMIVYDEAHRILEKFGGSGDGLDQVERGAREFRKWGIGMVLLSQVVSDFPGEVRANVGTTVQMRTQYEGDLDRLKDKFGMDTVQSVAKAEVGSGMVQNSDYNHGRPYFVNFRPMLHSPHRLSDEKLDKYESYNRRIDEMEERIDELEEQGEEVYELRSQLKLTKKNLRKGSFNLVDIYIEELEDSLQ